MEPLLTSLICSLIYSLYLKQCLTYSIWSINICWMNQRTNEWVNWVSHAVKLGGGLTSSQWGESMSAGCTDHFKPNADRWFQWSNAVPRNSAEYTQQSFLEPENEVAKTCSRPLSWTRTPPSSWPPPSATWSAWYTAGPAAILRPPEHQDALDRNQGLQTGPQRPACRLTATAAHMRQWKHWPPPHAAEKVRPGVLGSQQLSRMDMLKKSAQDGAELVFKGLGSFIENECTWEVYYLREIFRWFF